MISLWGIKRRWISTRTTGLEDQAEPKGTFHFHITLHMKTGQVRCYSLQGFDVFWFLCPILQQKISKKSLFVQILIQYLYLHKNLSPRIIETCSLYQVQMNWNYMVFFVKMVCTFLLQQFFVSHAIYFTGHFWNGVGNWEQLLFNDQWLAWNCKMDDLSNINSFTIFWNSLPFDWGILGSELLSFNFYNISFVIFVMFIHEALL